MTDETNDKAISNEDRANLLKMVKEFFPLEKPEGILVLLQQYGDRPHEREVFRVRRNILKLSNGQKDRIASLVQQAKADYRDIIVCAEYEPIKKEEAVESLEVIADMLSRSGQEKEADLLKEKAMRIEED